MSDAERREVLPLGPRLARLVAPDTVVDPVRLRPALPGVPPVTEPDWIPPTKATEERATRRAAADGPIADSEPRQHPEHPKPSASEPVEETPDPPKPRSDPDDDRDPEPTADTTPSDHAADLPPIPPERVPVIERQTVIVPVPQEVERVHARATPPEPETPRQQVRRVDPEPPPVQPEPVQRYIDLTRAGDALPEPSREPQAAKEPEAQLPASIRVTGEAPAPPDEPTQDRRVPDPETLTPEVRIATLREPHAAPDTERPGARIVPVAAQSPEREPTPAPRPEPEERPAPRPEVRVEIGAVNISLRPPEPQRQRPALSVARRAPRAHAIPLAGFEEE